MTGQSVVGICDKEGYYQYRNNPFVFVQRLQKLKEQAELRSYTTLFNSDEMVSNNQGGEDSDDSDFM